MIEGTRSFCTSKISGGSPGGRDRQNPKKSKKHKTEVFLVSVVGNLTSRNSADFSAHDRLL